MRTLYIDCGMGAAGDMLTAALLDLVPDPEEAVRELNEMGIPGVRYEMVRMKKQGISGMHMKVLVHGVEEEPLPDDSMAEGHDHGDHAHGDHAHGEEHGHAHEGHFPEEHHHEEHAHGHPHGDHPEEEHHHGEHAHHHHGMHLSEIEALIRKLHAPETVKEDACAIYSLIADAECTVHESDRAEVHFHELGMMDAVADVCAASFLMRRLDPKRIVASPVRVGYGHLHCAHGILPVPAPATALILRGMPNYAGDLAGEFCTPTGAAILRHFVHEYGRQPVMAADRIGTGFGTKDFPVLNCVRTLLGEDAAEELPEKHAAEDRASERILTLACNLDDCTAEETAFAMEELLSAGALDVFTVPAGMKKSRPGTILTVLAYPEKEQLLTELLMKYTPTLGVRVTECTRYTLSREERTVETELGPVRVKRASGYGTEKEKAEYEDLAALARRHGLTLAEVRGIVLQALRERD